MKNYLKQIVNEIDDSLMSVDDVKLEDLLSDCCDCLKKGHKIITTGLGKNTAICEKFVGTMLSFGKSASFMHTNTAIHGDVGMVQNGDLVLILTKSGSTEESIYLFNLLQKREAIVWLLTFNEEGILSKKIDKKIVLKLSHEGDLWNIVPNNSTTVNLIVLQALAIKIAEKTGVQLDDFKRNHPGGSIGAILKNV